MRKVAYVTTLILILLSCGVQNRSVTATGSPSAEDYPDSLKAIYYYTEGLRHAGVDTSLVEAATLYRKALETDSTFAPAMYQLALVEIDGNNAQKAFEYSRRALALDSTNKWYRIQYGRMLLYMEQYDKALTEFKKITADAPTNPDNYRLLAALYIQLKMPFSAIEVLDSAELKAGLYGSLHQQKCALLANTGQTERARTELERYRAIFPYDEQNNLLLASLYGYIHKDSLQTATLKEVLASNPTSTEALLSLSDIYRRDGKQLDFLATQREIIWNKGLSMNAKIKIFEDLTSDRSFYGEYYLQLGSLASAIYTQYPESYRAAELYATHLIRTGETDKAAAIYKEQLANPSSGIRNIRNIIGYESYMKRTDSVMYYCDKAIEMFPDDIESYIQKGSWAQYTEQNELAKKCYREALRYADGDSLRSSVTGLLADLYHQAGNDKKAFKMYEQALRLHADNVHALNNYAYFLTLEGRQLDRAVKMARRAVELQSGNATYLDTYAWALFRSGQKDEAKKIMRQAISLDRNDSPELYVHYGDMLYDSGDKFMAQVYWRRALERGYDADKISQKLNLP